MTEGNDNTTSKSNKRSGALSALLTGNFFTQENAVRQLPFVFFLTFLALLYIANGFLIESKVRGIQRAATEIKELRSEQISIKSELNNTIIESELKKIIDDRGIPLVESRVPPRKVVVKSRDLKRIN